VLEIDMLPDLDDTIEHSQESAKRVCDYVRPDRNIKILEQPVMQERPEHVLLSLRDIDACIYFTP
jgi:hypothetical protein